MDINYDFTCFLNYNYRALLSKGRTYAAFNDSFKTKDEMTPKKCASELGNRGIKEVLDPMAGYGTIMKYGREYNFNSYMVEINLPAHLWQLLISEQHSNKIVSIINEFIRNPDKWPAAASFTETSSTWYGCQGLSILCEVFLNILHISKTHYCDSTLAEKIALGILLPFCLRLSTAQKGDTVHIKQGGVAVLLNYQEDLMYYLKELLLPLLAANRTENIQPEIFEFTPANTSVYADSALHEFPKAHFQGMLTSPPYPNGIDYRKMFIAEHSFIEHLYKHGVLHFEIINSHIAGTNVVKGRKTNSIQSTMAKQFLMKLRNLKLSRSARYDMDVYYLPYYNNYFSDIERLFVNVIDSLADRFLGYIVVTNNAIRKIEVPVSNFIIELWNNQGFNAECIKEKEISHIGTKNPNSKGRMARHTEHIVKVWRNIDA